MDLGPLLLREIAGLRFNHNVDPFWHDNGLDNLISIDFWKQAIDYTQKGMEAELRRKSFRAFSERGAYPIAHEKHKTPWPELAGHLNETVIKRAIQHDLRMGPRGQKR